VGAVLELDEAGRGKLNQSYRVNSLCLDSAQLTTFWPLSRLVWRHGSGLWAYPRRGGQVLRRSGRALAPGTGQLRAARAEPRHSFRVRTSLCHNGGA